MILQSPTQAEPLLQAALETVLARLRSLVDRPDRADLLTQAFGENANLPVAETLLRTLAAGKLPRVEVVNPDVLDGAYGAFVAASNTILVSGSLAHSTSADHAALLPAVLLEEIGHYIDARVNAADAPGDEGEIFARLAQGARLGQAELQSLRLQNDHAAISVDGKTAAVEEATLLDGSLSDWTAADRLDDEASGVAGYEAYGRYDAGTSTFELALRSPVPIGANSTIWLNTDRNLATGYQVFGFAAGAEYNINFDASGTPHLYTGADGQTLVPDATVDFAYSADRTVVEMTVSGAALGGTQALDAYIDVNNSAFLPNDYSNFTYTVAAPQAPAQPATVGAVTLDGSLAEWSDQTRIDRVAPVNGWEVYGRVSDDSYVFAIKAPAGTTVGPNTTAWLNTDQDVTTGFQIFATSGGAEYNINFDSNGVPFLFTGDAGATPASTDPLPFARSADGTTVEFAVAKAAIGNPTAIDALIDVNNTTFLPGNFSGPAYTVLDNSDLPARTDVSKKVAIVYSDTTAERYFGDPALPGQHDINLTAYSQLFMAAQNQAAMAGVPYDILTEADLTDLSKLVNYDAIVFPSFQFVNSANVTAIENNLKLLTQNYDTSLIAAGNFMTADQNGTVLPGDAYARMKELFDVAPQASGFSGSTSAAITSAGTGFDGVGGYTAGEAIHTYSNTAGVGWLAFTDATPGTTPLTVIDNETITGTGAGTYAAVTASSINGDRNVHFSTEALLGDNNQLWQAIQYAVDGTQGPTVGLQMTRGDAIVAARIDMDQAQEASDVTPEGGGPGIYNALLPILNEWKADYNFVGSYYIDIGNNPPDQQTNWAVSGPLYQQILAMGNEIGTHSFTHPEDTNTLTPAQIEFEFNQSQLLIEQQLGIDVTGAAVPGAPEHLATALEILPYFDYITGGYAGVGAGYPGAIGYILPSVQNQVYIAPNATFDFTLNDFRGMTPAQADAFWAQEWASLTAHADAPVVVWPFHDYGPTTWPVDATKQSPYDVSQYTDYIARAAAAGAEFITLDDLASRVESFDNSSVSYAVSGDVVTADVTSPDAGRFALDLDNLGAQTIASVAGWYAYDTDSVFTDRDGGTYAITLGATQADVSHITDVGDRNELVSLTGDGTDLSFRIVGEGNVIIDLANEADTVPIVTGANIVSQVGDVLTLDIGAIGTHDVAVSLVANHPPVITSNGGGATAAISYAENGIAPVTTVTATDADAGQALAYSLDGGADAALFSIDPTTGALTFKTAPDFEAPADQDRNNVYDVIVKAADTGSPSTSDTQALAITVTNVNDPPVITSNGGGATAAISYAENGTAAVTTVTATDADAGQTLAYSLAGGADA
ncbi:MAG: cadherin domain-containing protein, partial [Hyphomicrobiaceae bacterium]|nr:cadherin domain-containing protein [Hyphomicrobiaceae bacterium]